MSPSVPYSASQQDLFYPAKSLDSFPTKRPKSDAELCAWMALLAYCDQFPDFAFDCNKIASKLAPLGFRPVNFCESQGHERNGGTHCFLAVHEDAVKENRLAVVAFRGTDKDDPTDVLDDVDAPHADWKGSAKVFDGWKDALAEVENELYPALQQVDCKLLITGHSLGAALATLLASIRTPDALYTIGSPRVGNTEFVSSLGGVKNFRYVDCCDAVTELPPEVLGYAHLGDPLYIDRNRKMNSNPGDDFISSDRWRARVDYFLHYFWKSGNVGARELADHAPINYVTAIAAANP
ncbi:MAG TPA: lipase family protein [Candidatus Acidoferrum sp.]|nr:lipase family protein [Candidatus Acidoferrum sp.]